MGRGGMNVGAGLRNVVVKGNCISVDEIKQVHARVLRCVDVR